MNSLVDRIRTRERRFRSFGIDRLYLFGSYVRGETSKGSDLDVLVRFSAGRHGGYFDLARVKGELEDDLGMTVDVQLEGGAPDPRAVLQDLVRVF